MMETKYSKASSFWFLKTTLYEGEQLPPKNLCKIRKKIKYLKNLNEVVKHPSKIRVPQNFLNPIQNCNSARFAHLEGEPPRGCVSQGLAV